MTHPFGRTTDRSDGCNAKDDSETFRPGNSIVSPLAGRPALGCELRCARTGPPPAAMRFHEKRRPVTSFAPASSNCTSGVRPAPGEPPWHGGFPPPHPRQKPHVAICGHPQALRGACIRVSAPRLRICRPSPSPFVLNHPVACPAKGRERGSRAARHIGFSSFASSFLRPSPSLHLSFSPAIWAANLAEERLAIAKHAVFSAACGRRCHRAPGCRFGLPS